MASNFSKINNRIMLIAKTDQPIECPTLPLTIANMTTTTAMQIDLPDGAFMY